MDRRAALLATILLALAVATGCVATSRTSAEAAFDESMTLTNMIGAAYERGEISYEIYHQAIIALDAAGAARERAAMIEDVLDLLAETRAYESNPYLQRVIDEVYDEVDPAAYTPAQQRAIDNADEAFGELEEGR